MPPELVGYASMRDAGWLKADLPEQLDRAVPGSRLRQRRGA
jgi:hypothetical protein